ncbi:MAG: hydrogenase maturation peptidase HycI [Candidatus Bathyarchaeota archaeon]|nr:hydrogenase maturation peptidase HycI [Candidatus Bathyarchaeota archaeon]
MGLEADLREFFGDGDKRVILVGVGNPLRGDDGVGVQIIERLQEMNPANVLLLNTETVPEAFTGKVIEYKPTHVLLLDAAQFKGYPGETRLIDSEKIGGQVVSTHSLPLTIFINYIEKTLDVKVLLLGIQPRTIEFYSKMTREVSETGERVAQLLYRILTE